MPLKVLVVAVVVLAFLIVKRLGQARPEVALDWLRKGALVIDVRSESEYQERHLAGTINLPVARVGQEINRYAADKERPLLLHCLSGTRSGMAANTLKRLGYRNVLNLGSYSRAAKILAGAQSSAESAP